MKKLKNKSKSSSGVIGEVVYWMNPEKLEQRKPNVNWEKCDKPNLLLLEAVCEKVGFWKEYVGYLCFFETQIDEDGEKKLIEQWFKVK